MERSDLHSILTLINESLRFAETKNGVLLTLNISVATAVTQLSSHTTCFFFPYLKALLVLLMLTSAGACMWSFLPRLTESKLLGKNGEKNDRINPFFFGEIAKLSNDEYAELISAVLNEGKMLSQAQRAYTDQIKANSTIASLKFQYFKFGAQISAIGLVVLTILLITLALNP